MHVVRMDRTAWKAMQGPELFSAEEFEFHTPSRPYKSYEDEKSLRLDGGCFIMEMAKAIKVNHLTMYTAGLYFNVFYCRHSFPRKGNAANKQEKEKQRHRIAATCLYVACKVEDEKDCGHGHLLDCIAVAWAKVLCESKKEKSSKKDNSDLLKKMIVESEQEILDVVEYSFIVEQPFELLAQVIWKVFGPGFADRPEVLKEAADPGGLAAIAWTMVLDSVLTTLCVRYSSRTIAVAAVDIAMHIKEIKVEEEATGPWYEELFDVHPNDVRVVRQELLKANGRGNQRTKLYMGWLSRYRRPEKRKSRRMSNLGPAPKKTSKSRSL